MGQLIRLTAAILIAATATACQTTGTGNNVPGASPEVRQKLRQAPPVSLLAVAFHQIKRGNFGNALAITHILLQRPDLAPDLRSDAHILRAEAFERSGSPDRAQRELDDALKANPNSALVYTNRARFAIRRRQLPQAIRDINKSLEIKPTAQAYVVRAFLQLTARNIGAAVRDSDAAIKLDPRNARAWSLRGTAYLILRNVAQARRSYVTALRLDPKQRSAREGLALLNWAMRRGTPPRRPPAQKLPAFRML